MYASASQIADAICLYAEARAMSKGIEYCVCNQLLPLIMETDSLTMKKIVDGEWETPWSISMTLKEINTWRMKGHIQFAHTLREDNTLADFSLTWFLILQVQAVSFISGTTN